MNRRIPAICIFIFLNATQLSARTDPQDIPIGNFGRVTENIYRGEKLDDEEDYRYLKDHGIATVINLRYFHEDDPRTCKKHKLYCVQFGLLLIPSREELFDWATFQRAFKYVTGEQGAPKKIYIHCEHGSDRTGALA